MIEGSDVYDYFSCMYKVYNKHNRDRSLMIPFSDFNKRLMEMGRNHEHEVVSNLPYEEPKYQRGDFEDGYAKTIALMKKGVPFIYQGLLKNEEYLGIPDLLIRHEGTSKFGDYCYIPCDIKSSLRSKEEQIMQLIFYDMLLEHEQQSTLNKGILMLKELSELVSFEKYKEKFNEALKKIKKVAHGEDYGMHIDTVCKECPWRNVCVPLAKETHDVSLVYGLSRPTHYKLLEKGIKTYEDLVQADASELSDINGVGEVSIKKWKEQAEVLISQTAKITPIKLADVKHHVCLDIENTEEGSVYLIGLWQNETFTYFFSDDDEEKIIKEFVAYAQGLESYKLYHYGSIEKTVFRNLFEKYAIEHDVAQTILSNMVDLLPLVRKHMILPITYYNLKDVAKYLGFKWRASDASGSNSMVWYEDWKSTKNPELLKKILEYNEDDVHGTDVILKKLAELK